MPGQPDSSSRLPSPLCVSNCSSIAWEPFPPRPRDTQRGSSQEFKYIKCKYQLAFIEGLLCAGH